MLSVTRADGRRVFALGVAGLVPAALLTLLLVHQPAIGDRRLYPMLRGSLTVVGLVLALATLVLWAADRNRFSRTTLSGLAWAGVTALLCIGPLLESSPRARLYALDLGSGEVAWAWKRAVTSPVLVNGDLVVSDVGSNDLIGLDPATGRERWRRPPAEGDSRTPVDMDPTNTLELVDGTIAGAGAGTSWTLSLPGETVLDVAGTGNAGYAYVATPGAAGGHGGSIVRFDVDDGHVRWQAALPASVTAAGGMPAIGAGGDAVVIAGGERIAALAASDGGLLWSQSVVALGKSRGYSLPGAVQEVIVTDSLVFLLATPPA